MLPDINDIKRKINIIDAKIASLNMYKILLNMLIKYMDTKEKENDKERSMDDKK